MKNKLTENLYESCMSVMPIAFLIIFISFIINIPSNVILSFGLSSILLVFGITFFTLGADMSMIVIGNSIGEFLVKKKNKILILIVSLIIGFVITMSEPDLNVFAKEITAIPNKLIVGLVSVGIGIFLMIGVFRILKKFSFRMMITMILLFIFGLLFITPKEFISIAFDGGAVTTGPVGVPLILAFGYGITKIRSDETAKSDSFGLCGIASLGPIVIILLLGLFFKPDNYFDTTGFINRLPLLDNFINHFIISLKDVLLSLMPVVIVFIIYQVISKKMNKYQIIKIIVGFILVIMGLTIFLTGVSTGFMETGYRIGSVIAGSNYKYFLIPLGMIMGYIIINAEPAVKILNKQISDLTEGSISEKMIKLCLSLGVCLAIGLSLLRIFFSIPIIYIVVPGYFIAGLLMYHTPRMFMTIAFDSGGAASGAMTTSFLLPLCIGACEILNGNILVDAFGVGALVGLSPILTIQLLGIIYHYKLKVKEKEIFNEEIIEFSWEAS